MEIEKYIEFGKMNAIYNVNKKEFDMEKWYTLDVKKEYPNISVKKYILQETSCMEKRMVDSLKLVHLDEEILTKKMNVLSTSEKLKLELAILLILNVDYILLDKFNFYFMEKELLFFKKLFKKLGKKYQKTFVFLDCDVTFLFDLADRVIYAKKKKEYIVVDNPTFYENDLYSFAQEPKIVEFVNFLNENGRKILPYTDLKELLKAIFREV